MSIKINGQDWTGLIDPYSIRPYHEKRQGINAGISMGGSEILDTVAVKTHFDAMVGIVDQAGYEALMKLAKLDFVTVEYNDFDTGKKVTRVMILTTGKPGRFPSYNGKTYYKNISLNFRER